MEIWKTFAKNEGKNKVKILKNAVFGAKKRNTRRGGVKKLKKT